ncbi:MAG: flagellar assembly peptidoglycan hydrolase FlgJ [Burkholderiaceae bacterium]|jgi:flagellar protein FlgJ|nr:flagellar assembly peptidoglycan hydrolase FlgJ [Burkholderiaceae bacterium]
MREVAGLAVDAGALSRLRQQASADPRQAVREAAAQFEALFMQQMLKSMREAIPKSGLLDGPGQSTYESMLDSQLAQSVGGRPGGLADVLARQLSRHIEGGRQPAAVDESPAPGGDRIGADLQRRPEAELSPGLRRTMATASMATISTVGGLPGVLAGALGRTAVDAVRAEATGAVADAGRAGKSAAGRSRASPAQVEFVDRMFAHARAAQRATGVPAEFIVGQAALESGWGRAEMRHPDGRPAHNLFGIKAGSGWRGQTVDVLTTEYVNGEPRKSVEQFRAYGSYAEAFTDWARLMKGSSRYGEVLKAGTSAEAFASGLQRAGYATDPNYASKLERTIERAVELRRLQI